MTILVDLSYELGGAYAAIVAEVIAVLFRDGCKLYAITVHADGAPWYGLVHQNSTAFLGEDQS